MEEIKRCPNCGSKELRYSPRGFTIGGIVEGWMCRNCKLLLGYGEEEDEKNRYPR